VAERWFLFVQLEFPWELGLEDGRYLLRHAGAAAAFAGDPEPTAGMGEAKLGTAGEPEHVVVLATMGAARPSWIMPRSRRKHVRQADPQTEATPVPVTRATTIDPASVSEERQAQAWLSRCRAEREGQAATAVLNRVLWAHGIATADPYTREVTPAQALVIRAGWGTGDQVSQGHWEQARELAWKEPRSRRRTSALRPQERLSALLSGREEALLCEELTLRARRDVDQGRMRHAALELEGAYAAAVVELAAEDREDLASRVAELRDLQATLQVEHPPEEAVRHALARLEAALRARTAAGVAGAVEGS
jgi:hypothetical protein